MNSWVSLVVGITPPLATLLLKVFSENRDTASVARIEKHSALVEKLPEAAQPALVKLLEAEVERYTNRRLKIAQRKLDKSTLSALIFVAAVTAVWISVGTFWALNTSWWLWVPTTLGGLFGIALITVGTGQLYEYPDEQSTDTR